MTSENIFWFLTGCVCTFTLVNFYQHIVAIIEKEHQMATVRDTLMEAIAAKEADIAAKNADLATAQSDLAVLRQNAANAETGVSSILDRDIEEVKTFFSNFGKQLGL